MSEDHTQANEETGAGETSRRSQVAETEIEGSTVTFTFANGRVVSLDVSKLPPVAKDRCAAEGARNVGRLSFQKIEDPDKAASALQSKFDKMLAGDVLGSRRRRERVVDDLTQALANIYGKSPSYIEETWYPKYFANPISECTFNTDKRGKVKIYGKSQALAALREDARVKEELNKIAKERGTTKKKPTQKIDFESLAA
jgi:hypothetical protein